MNLTPTKKLIVTALTMKASPLTLTELCYLLNSSARTVDPLLTEMIADGLIARGTSDNGLTFTLLATEPAAASIPMLSLLPPTHPKQ